MDDLCRLVVVALVGQSFDVGRDDFGVSCGESVGGPTTDLDVRKQELTEVDVSRPPLALDSRDLERVVAAPLVTFWSQKIQHRAESGNIAQHRRPIKYAI